MWNLPFVRSIELTLQGQPFVHFESFDQCPQLEVIYLKVHRFEEQPLEQNGVANFGTIVLSGKLKLPRLKSLELYDIAALAFNFDSLDDMENLQQLHFIESYEIQHPVTSIPQLRSYVNRQGAPNSSDNISPEHADQKWKDRWNLPQLQTLRLEGAPSSVLSFSWLIGCPTFETVKLAHKTGLQRLPISSASEYANFISKALLTTAVWSEDTWNTSMDPDLQPLFESKLHRLTLSGSWAMSETDLITALTVYAPNLSTLSLDRIHMQATRNGKRVLKTLFEAKAIG